MAGSSLLALIDDIASVLDDVAILTKIAAKKTSGVLGDDLALNAQQVAGVSADRELPVVFAVAKGSALNKLILVPSALIISQFLPVIIIPMLMLGGAFLCYEGFEKIFEKFFHKISKNRPNVEELPTDKNFNIAELESEKIKGAIRTDFILSAEIIVITLGTVAQSSLQKQALVLVGIAVLMTIGVYGLVAAIVKLDDLGLYLNQKGSAFVRKFGQSILLFAPYLMKSLGIIGTVAMFLVGGGIISHNISILHHLIENLNGVFSLIFDLILGLVVGAFVFLNVSILKKQKTKTG